MDERYQLNFAHAGLSWGFDASLFSCYKCRSLQGIHPCKACHPCFPQWGHHNTPSFCGFLLQLISLNHWITLSTFCHILLIFSDILICNKSARIEHNMAFPFSDAEIISVTHALCTERWSGSLWLFACLSTCSVDYLTAGLIVPHWEFCSLLILVIIWVLFTKYIFLLI